MTNPNEGYLPDWSQTKRRNGLLVIGGIVLIGLWPAAVLFYKAPKLKVEFNDQLAVEAGNMTVQERLVSWQQHGAPQVHNHLASNSRNGAKLPWIVTHRFDPKDGEPTEVWGIDVDSLPRNLTRVEGDDLVVVLPQPTLLGRLDLPQASEAQVPIYTDRAAVEDPQLRLKSLAMWFLEGLPAAMEKDIPGSRFVIRVVDELTPAQGESGD